VIGHFRIPDGPEINRVECQQLVERVDIHHSTVAKIKVTAPRKGCELQREAAARGGRVQDLHASGNHFLADAVAGKHCDAMGAHGIRSYRVTCGANP